MSQNRFNEIAKIKEKFKEVIQYSQGIQNPLVNDLIDNWYKAKKNFIEDMGGNFIYEYPELVSFHLDSKEKLDRLDSFIEDICLTRFKNDLLADFLATNRDGFYDNITSQDYTWYINPEETKIIKTGVKLVKAFKYFVKDSEDLYTLQTLASQLIQEDKVTGYLCVSVHPLDFLSSSENTLNWRSCHALDGEFRAGNLSYMLDETTFMVYLRAEEDDILPHFPFRWNNKKWRNLMFMSKDQAMLMAGRPYPFTSTSGLNFVLKNLLSAAGIIEANRWTDWRSDKIHNMTGVDGTFYELDEDYYPIGLSLKASREFIIDNGLGPHYNDLIYSSCYTPVYSFKKERFWNSPTGCTDENTTKFYIGAEVSCLECGEENVGRGDGMMHCIACEEKYGTRDDEDFYYCHHCGRHIHHTHGQRRYDNNDNIIWAACNDCLEKYYISCNHCGRYMLKEKVNKYIKNDMTLYICDSCNDYYEMKITEEIDEPVQRILDDMVISYNKTLAAQLTEGA